MQVSVYDNWKHAKKLLHIALIKTLNEKGCHCVNWCTVDFGTRTWGFNFRIFLLPGNGLNPELFMTNTFFYPAGTACIL